VVVLAEQAETDKLTAAGLQVAVVEQAVTQVMVEQAGLRHHQALLKLDKLLLLVEEQAAAQPV
jgi:hypothetical protein